MYYLGAPSHAAFAPLFVALGVPLLGYFNIFSAVAWVFALWLTNNGRYRLAIDMLTLEVIGFSAIARSPKPLTDAVESSALFALGVALSYPGEGKARGQPPL